MAHPYSKLKTEKCISDFPQKIRRAHTHSIYNRTEIEGSDVCGCFCCCRIFSPDEIDIWVDENSDDIGLTALCPYCLIDSVIGSLSGFSITEEFIKEMSHYWFSKSKT